MSRLVFSAALVTALLSGCNGTFKTHVEPKGGFRSFALGDCKATYPAAICTELDYANQWTITYLEAGGNPSDLRNGVALATLPLTALALYYGITGHGSPSGIAGLSIAAATGYAGASYFGDKGKQAVYFEGARSMNCVQLAAVPALVPTSTVTTVRDEVEKLESSLSALAAYGGFSADELQSIAVAKTIAGAARGLLAFVEVAPYELHLRINEISIQVDKLLHDQEPGLDKLLSLAGNLKSVSQTFSGGFLPAPSASDSTKKETAQKGESPEEKEANEAKKKHLDAVAKHAETLRQILVRYQDVQKAFAGASSCAPVKQSGDFTVSPADSAVTIAVGKSQTFAIADTTSTAKEAFPQVAVSGKATDAIEVSNVEVEGGKLVLKVTGKTKTDSEGPTIAIHSADGSRIHNVQVLVSDAATGSSKPKPPAKYSDPRNDFEAALLKDPSNTLRVQCVVGLKGAQTDCKMGETTRKAIAKFKNGTDDSIDESLKSKADQIEIANGCDSPDPKCVGE